MKRCNDDELLYLVRCGNEYARDYLLEIYYYRIKSWMKSFEGYCYLGYELDDFVQIGMTTFWNAILAYRDDQNTSLCTYVKASIFNRVYNLISFKKERRFIKENRFVSLDEYIEDEGRSYGEVIGDPAIIYQPERIFAVRETTTQYITTFQNKATPVEKEVMSLKYVGYSENEISKILNIPLKSVYNAVYRGHRKVSIDEGK